MLSATNTHMGACEWYALAASAKVDEHISWQSRGDIGGSMQRGSLGDSELRMMLAEYLELWALKAIWWDLHLASLLTHLLSHFLFAVV